MSDFQELLGFGRVDVAKARAELAYALRSVPKRAWHDYVLLLRVGEPVTILSRADLARDLRRAGLYDLARGVMQHPVLPGQLLAFTDGEGFTDLQAVTLPRDIEHAPVPAIFRHGVR
jgi:hypothetical protein